MGRRRRAARVPQHNINSLPDDLCQHISRFAALDIDDISDLRTVAPWWSAPAARLVKRLAARGCLLPAKAWTVFQNATGLVILLEGVLMGEVTERLSELAEMLPEHLEHVSIPVPKASYSWSAVCTDLRSVGDQLASSACARSLKAVIIDVCIPPAAADALLRGLTCLEQAKLRIRRVPSSSAPANGQHHTFTSFPATLQDLQLDAAGDDDAQLHIDTAAFAACTKLQHVDLTLSNTQLLNPTSISSCKALNTFQLDMPSGQSNGSQLSAALFTAASKLQVLKLSGAEIHCSSEEWQQLTSLPHLHTLTVGLLVMDTTDAAPAQHITHMDIRQLELPPELLAADAAAGRLAQLLPAAQELRNRHTSSIDNHEGVSIGWLLHLLQGHQQLQVLYAMEAVHGRVDIYRRLQQHHLSSFPKLRSASFYGMDCTPADDILRAAAQCTTLHELAVGPAGGDLVTAAGLRALAAGACSKTLQKLGLGSVMPVTQLAVLFGGGMPALRVVQAIVDMREEMMGARMEVENNAEVVQEVQQLLEDAGVEGCVGFRVAEEDDECWPHDNRVRMEGHVGDCQLSFAVWL